MTGTYLSSIPGDTGGRASPLTVLTPLPRHWRWLQRGVLRLRRRLGPDHVLERLSFIHFAHWVTIDHFPDEREATRYAYLLFQSNFNGTWGKYIDAFSVIIPWRMALIWTTSFGFPGALPPKPFREYVGHNNLPVDHYYSAYPEASVTEIASAMLVNQLFDQMVRPAIDAGPAAFAGAWRRFVDAAQRDL